MPPPAFRFRWLLMALAVGVTIVAMGGILAFHSGVQTWTAQRYLRAHPELGVTVARVDAGLNHVRLQELTVTEGGYRVAIPEAEAEVSLVDWVVRERLSIRRLRVRDFVASEQGPPGAAASASSAADAPAFAGIFPREPLPFDLSVDQAQLQGRLRVRGAEATVDLSGGGLGAGREGAFTVKVKASLRGRDVPTVSAEGTVRLRMESARSLAAAGATIEATAEGGTLAEPVTLQTGFTAARDGRDETYSISVEQAGRKLASIDARLSTAATTAVARLSGQWTLDVRDGDLVPFALGRAIPAFAATGTGNFDTKDDLSAWNLAGVVDGHVENPGVLLPKLAPVGPLRLVSAVDIAVGAGVVTVSKFELSLGRDKPVEGAVAVAVLRALQPFAVEPRTWEVRPSNPAVDLVSIALQQLPLAWVRPFLGATEIAGADATGEWLVSPRAGGITFRTRTPLKLGNLAVHHAGRPLLRELDVAVTAAGDVTPRGWQTELNAVAGQGSAKSLWLHAKAGRLAGADEPVKATGLVTLDLGAVAAQPFAREVIALRSGDASIEFSGHLGSSQQIQAVIGVENLVASGPNAPPLPGMSTTLRAERRADGRITLSAPLLLHAGDRRSDVTLSGWLQPAGAGGTFEVTLGSDRLVMEDAKAYAAVLVPATPTVAAEGPPAWAHWSGSLALNCKSVLYAGAFEMTNLTGTIRLQDGAVKFEQVRAAVGSGEATAAATLAVEHEIYEPFRLDADFALRDFDPGPLFQTVNPRQPPTVSGRFALSTKLQARSPSLAALPDAALGDIQVTSRGGVFRGLPVNVGNLVENSSKLAGWLAAAGDAIKSPFVGKRDFEEITSRSQAANELARLLSAIEYDQLSLRIVQEGPFHSRVREFTLISPELRLTGTGLLRRSPGESPLTEVVEMDLRLSARGRAAELMKYLGILDDEADALGYAACTLPIRVEGALDQLDTTHLSNRLVALAVEKTGLTEKALDWINRLRGKGAN